MRNKFIPLLFVAGLSCLLSNAQVIAKDSIDFSDAKLLLEIKKITVVTKERTEHSGNHIPSMCGPKHNECEMSQEDKISARMHEERWWEDKRGDEWYEKSEYLKYEGSETWEFVGNQKAKAGSSEFVARPQD